MSDFENLRKTYANLWLIASFSFFVLAISGIWAIFVLIHNFFLFFCTILAIMFLSMFSYFAAENFYEDFVSVEKENIIKSDSAKLMKLKGVIFLISAFIVLALATNCFWGFFVFGKTFEIFVYLIITFFSSIALFLIFICGTYNNFARVEELINQE